MTVLTRRSALAASGAVGAALLAPSAARAATAGSSTSASAPSGEIAVASGETVTISSTTRVAAVTIASGGTLAAPSGYSLTMTVNGVETGQALTATSGADTAFVAGSWRGDIVLTVTKAVDITWQSLTYPFRQAVYVAGDAVVEDESVFAAVVGGRLSSTSADNVKISSTGECFDGVYVSDSTYTLTRPHISLVGNGRCDFVGYGAAIVADGTSANVIVDGAVIDNRGAVRTGVIVENGATALIKNS